MEEVLGNRQVLMRVADMQRTALLAVTVNIVGIGDDGRKARDQLDRLAHQVVARRVVGVRIESVHFEHATCQYVHDVLSFEVEDVHLRFLFERHAVADQFPETRQLFLVGKLSGQEQVGNLFETETFFLDQTMRDVFHVVSAIKELSGDCFQAAFRQTFVADNVTYFCQTDQYTRTVFVTKPALHIVFWKQIVVYFASLFGCVRQFVNDIFLFHRSKFKLHSYIKNLLHYP